MGELITITKDDILGEAYLAKPKQEIAQGLLVFQRGGDWTSLLDNFR